MKKGQEIVAKLPNLLIIHQKFPGRELGRHIHKEHEVFIPLQGEIKVEFEQKRVTGSNGKMLYVPPNIEHSFSSSASGEGERVILLIEDRLWKRITDQSFDLKSIPMNSLIRELVFYLLLKPKSKHVKTFVNALVEVIVEQLEHHGEIDFESIEHLEGKIKDIRIKKAYQYIVESGDTTSSELAKVSGLSTRNLNRLFLNEVGFSPKQFMIQLKIERAKRLLKTTDKTITDISFDVGYNSLSKFITAFQKATGELPSTFRNSV